MKDVESIRLDNQLCFAVYAASHAFTAAYKPLLEPLGLTYSQYLVLIVLWEQDGLTLKEIGARLHLDSGTLTPLLKRLEAGGLVHRRRDGTDERLLRVVLTDRGRTIQADAATLRQKVVCGLGGAEEPLQELRRSLTALLPLLRAMPAQGSTTGEA